MCLHSKFNDLGIDGIDFSAEAMCVGAVYINMENIWNIQFSSLLSTPTQ